MRDELARPLFPVQTRTRINSFLNICHSNEKWSPAVQEFIVTSMGLGTEKCHPTAYDMTLRQFI